ncbi:MAG: hypothetical protein IT303_16770 [Dehalococcoidia bacterium]|nr:hypothetical protein [Dehalococcoidia bacterium]
MPAVLRPTPRRGAPRAALRRALPLVLLAALLPMLSYAGHWELHLRLPGFEATTPAAHTHDHHAADATHSDDADRHAEHCHGGPASCSDVPFAGSSAFALAGQALAVLGSEGQLLALAALTWAPHRGQTIVPELRPPRPSPAA